MLKLLFQPHGCDDCPESVWKPPSANPGGRAGSFTEEKQVKGRECCQDEESRHDRAGMESQRPCTPEERGSGTCSSSRVTVSTENQNPQDHARRSWSRSSHTMTGAHAGSSIRMSDRPGWVFTPPVASILGNFRQISFSWCWVRVKKTDWKSLKSLTT